MNTKCFIFLGGFHSLSCIIEKQDLIIGTNVPIKVHLHIVMYTWHFLMSLAQFVLLTDSILPFKATPLQGWSVPALESVPVLSDKQSAYHWIPTSY